MASIAPSCFADLFEDMVNEVLKEGHKGTGKRFEDLNETTRKVLREVWELKSEGELYNYFKDTGNYSKSRATALTERKWPNQLAQRMNSGTDEERAAAAEEAKTALDFPLIERFKSEKLAMLWRLEKEEDQVDGEDQAFAMSDDDLSDDEKAVQEVVEVRGVVSQALNGNGFGHCGAQRVTAHPYPAKGVGASARRFRPREPFGSLSDIAEGNTEFDDESAELGSADSLLTEDSSLTSVPLSQADSTFAASGMRMGQISGAHTDGAWLFDENILHKGNGHSDTPRHSLDGFSTSLQEIDGSVNQWFEAEDRENLNDSSDPLWLRLVGFHIPTYYSLAEDAYYGLIRYFRSH